MHAATRSDCLSCLPRIFGGTVVVSGSGMRAGVFAIGASIVVVGLAAVAAWLVLSPPCGQEPAAASVAQQEDAGDTRAKGADDAARGRRRVTSAPPRPKTDPAVARLRALRRLAETAPFAALEQLVAAVAARPELAERPAWRELRQHLEQLLTERVVEIADARAAADEARKLLPLVADPQIARLLREMATSGVEGAAVLTDRERETVGRAGTPDEAAILSRHLGFFGSAAQVDETSQLGVRLAELRRRDERRTKRARPLPVRDADAAEKRRLAQLDKLRQREALGLLDHIHAGLAWLALHQADDGHFGDRAAHQRCTELGHTTSCVEKAMRNDLAATALAVIAFLDFRDQDPAGHFEPTLSRAVAWLRGRVRPDGTFGVHGYPAGIALMALGQAASSSGEVELAKQLGAAWLVYTPLAGPVGGFRYKPHQGGDLSVTGWFVQGYEAAREAEVATPNALRVGLDRFVTSVWSEGPSFGYTKKGRRPTLDAVGMLSLMILRDEIDEKLRRDWTVHLARTDRGKRLDLYSLYYDVRMELALRGALTDHRRTAVLELARWYQQPDGDAAGRFRATADVERVKATPADDRPRLSGDDRWFRRAGPTVTTAFAVLILEHALYRR